MGYYTQYTLNVQSSDGNELEIIKQFRNECEAAKYAFDDNGDLYDEIKWYEHEEDLVTFSKKHPSVLFTLQGIGEESEDMWALYVKNGKRQRVKARIEYDPMDESKFN